MMQNPEKCPVCDKYFIVREEGLNVPGGKEKEPIRCPHHPCRYSREERTSGWFRTEKTDENGKLI